VGEVAMVVVGLLTFVFVVVVVLVAVVAAVAVVVVKMCSYSVVCEIGIAVVPVFVLDCLAVLAFVVETVIEEEAEVAGVGEQLCCVM
jgi:hypothetical protein